MKNLNAGDRVLAAKVPDAIYRRVAEIARREDRSLSSVLRSALRKSLDERSPNTAIE